MNNRFKLSLPLHYAYCDGASVSLCSPPQAYLQVRSYTILCSSAQAQAQDPAVGSQA